MPARDTAARSAAVLLAGTALAAGAAQPAIGQTTYWDGAGPANNGAVNGGAGTWTASSTGTAWTTSTGAVNGAWPRTVRRPSRGRRAW
ncbi:MAG: hypothetical protein WDN45_06050 [Caulobacteraceae bacterium]